VISMAKRMISCPSVGSLCPLAEVTIVWASRSTIRRYDMGHSLAADGQLQAGVYGAAVPDPPLFLIRPCS
jgi:hypothetical protein